MKHDIDEWIAEAIMSDTPILIVEGRDDIKFYENLREDLQKNIWIEAVENIEGYTGGSSGVLKVIEYIQPLFDQKENLEKYILGIVDRDDRYIRGEIRNHKGLFVLKAYSFESHFITRNNLRKLVTDITSVGKKHVDEKTLDYIEKNISSEFSDLYYLTLEALKTACVNGYVGVVRFGMEPGEIYSLQKYERIRLDILAKKSDLEHFAMEKHITPSDVKNIAKGKWLLHVYCNTILKKISKLKEACSSKEINSCNFCLAGDNKQCLWKPLNLQLGNIKQFLLNYIDENEVKYIKDRLMLLN